MSQSSKARKRIRRIPNHPPQSCSRRRRWVSPVRFSKISKPTSSGKRQNRRWEPKNMEPLKASNQEVENNDTLCTALVETNITRDKATLIEWYSHIRYFQLVIKKQGIFEATKKVWHQHQPSWTLEQVRTLANKALLCRYVPCQLSK